MTTHLTQDDLTALSVGLGDASLDAHVAGCASCRARVERVQAIALPDVGDFEPRSFEPLDESSGSLPAKGELWRLSWGEAHQLCLVVGTDADLFAVLPVALDPDDVADQWSVVIPASASPLAMSLAVLVQHRFSLPLRTFDARLGLLTQTWMDAVAAARTNFRTGAEVASGVPAIHTILDPRLEAQDELVDDFVTLTEAFWEPQIDTLGTSDFAGLQRVDSIEPGRFYELIRGASPTSEEVKQAAAEGVHLARPAYDRGLVAFLERPANSSRLRRMTRPDPEEVLFTEAADFLTERHLQTAARGADGDEWERLFQEFLDAQ